MYRAVDGAANGIAFLPIFRTVKSRNEFQDIVNVHFLVLHQVDFKNKLLESLNSFLSFGYFLVS